MSTDTDPVYITYTGNPAWVSMLVEMLVEEGLEVDYEPPGQDPLFGLESVVNLELAVTGHPSVSGSLNATVQRFRDEVPEAIVDIEQQGRPEANR